MKFAEKKDAIALRFYKKPCNPIRFFFLHAARSSPSHSSIHGRFDRSPSFLLFLQAEARLQPRSHDTRRSQVRSQLRPFPPISVPRRSISSLPPPNPVVAARKARNTRTVDCRSEYSGCRWIRLSLGNRRQEAIPEILISRCHLSFRSKLRFKD